MNVFSIAGILGTVTPDKLYGWFTFGATALIVLGVLILVHEYGHFIVARMVGVRVEKFSIGFGPRIVSWKKGDTDYMLSWIPLGGYVKFYGDEPDNDEIPQDDQESFLNQKVWKRLAIVAAGPIFNIVLAAVILAGVALIGVPTPTRVIDKIKETAPSYKAGLRVGDEILGVNGKPVVKWLDIDAAIVKNDLAPITFSILRPTGERRDITFTPDAEGKIGIIFDISKTKPVVAMPMEDKPAKRAGFSIGDTILSIDGKQVITREDVINMISPAAGKSIPVTVARDSGEQLTLNVVPEALPQFRFQPTIVSKQYGIFGSAWYGVEKTIDIVDKTLYALNLLVTREVSHRQIAGPIGIMQIAGTVAEQGLTRFLFFIALISVNLGILNLLPIPILDGGHIFFFSMEALLGRPVKMKVQEFAQNIGVVLLLSLMALAFYNDILRIING